MTFLDAVNNASATAVGYALAVKHGPDEASRIADQIVAGVQLAARKKEEEQCQK